MSYRLPPGPGRAAGGGDQIATIADKVKERLAAGRLALGLGLRQARTVDIGRILAACGYDRAFIDMEMEGALARSGFLRGLQS